MAQKFTALIRAAIGGAIMFIVTGFAGVTAALIALITPASPFLDRLARHWARLFLAVANTKTNIVGGRSIDPNRSYVIVSNHASDLDIAVCFVAAPVGIRFLAKKELFRVPFLGLVMRALGMIRVDRQAGEAGHADLNAQIQRTLSTGHSLMIFPEGTRSRSGALAPFKRGAFRIAIDHQMDVLPISILGTHDAWPSRSPWVYGGTVTVVLHDIIPVQGLVHDDLDAILRQAHDAIATGLTERRDEEPNG